MKKQGTKITNIPRGDTGEDNGDDKGETQGGITGGDGTE